VSSSDLENWHNQDNAQRMARSMPPGTLVRLTRHHCKRPAITDRSERRHYWTCPVCLSDWSWTSGLLWTCDMRTYQLEVQP